MRTTSHTEVTGLPKYGAVPPAEAKMLSQYMREQGYYTTNNYKTDYQFQAPKNAWDDSGIYAHWRNRPADKPFFRWLTLLLPMNLACLNLMVLEK
ncbi:hypothetical protein RS130_00385 [Paraglaciecola aquimarina]|uniref:Uncharacterized protein n=1 Tax=Paraglaciecola aquimarina TaxID=1235557 RepID=A0ABU3SRE7_9ALTE|nr:hypothetical protein [Paraglaciecola aquimarina]MDU0352569.1 hypothetical protein [Paraglaciecola aquimarina]